MIPTGWWNIDGWPTANEWSAWWTLIAIVPALAAGIAAIFAVWIAFRQLSHLIDSNNSLEAATDATSRSNLAVSRPYMTVDLEAVKSEGRNPQQALGGTLRVLIRNDGRSPAADVRLSVDPPFTPGSLEPEAARSAEEWLAKVFSGDIAFPMFRPGRVHAMLLDRIPGVFHSSTPREYRITVSYRSIDGQNVFEDTYPLSVSILGPSLAPNDWGNRISKDLQALNETIKKKR